MEWTKKRIRMALGIVMMYAFIMLSLALNFIIDVGFELSNMGYSAVEICLLLINLSWMYLSNVILIALIYVLLTRVFKYEKEK